MLYKSVAHTVLLYVRYSWVVTVAMLKVLEVLHHQAAQKIAVITAWCVEDIEW